MLWGKEVSPEDDTPEGEKVPELPRNVNILLCDCPHKNKEHLCDWRNCMFMWQELMETWLYYYVVTCSGEKVEMWREIQRIGIGVGGGNPGLEMERLWRTTLPHWWGNNYLPGAPGGSLIHYSGEPKSIWVKGKMESGKRVKNCKYGLWRQY